MKLRLLLIAVLAPLFLAGSCREEEGQGGKGGGGTKPPLITELPDQGENEYDVFLLIGQSNMAGRGTLIPGDDAAIAGVWLLDPEGNIEPASNPLNKYSSIRKDISHQQMNPGYAFSGKIYEKTGRKVLLVVNARGGTSLGEWRKGSSTNYYEEAVRRAKQGQQYGTLRGILWHQGESGSSNPSNYLSGLKTMVEALRADLGVPAAPFIAGEIAPWHQNADIFNPVIRGISGQISHSDWVTSEGITPLIDESDPHFSRDGQILIGGRYADKILRSVYNK